MTKVPYILAGILVILIFPNFNNLGSWFFNLAVYVIPLIIGLIFWGNKLTQNKEDKDE